MRIREAFCAATSWKIWDADTMAARHISYLKNFSMTAGIVMVMGLFVPLYSVINRAVYEIRPSWNFDISLYLPDGNIGMAGIHASSEILIRASIVGGAFVVICAAVAALIMQKRDVR